MKRISNKFVAMLMILALLPSLAFATGFSKVTNDPGAINHQVEMSPLAAHTENTGNAHHKNDGHGDSHHQTSIKDLFWFWINFSVFSAILFSLLRKPFSQFWSNRVEVIESAMNKGQRDVEVANEMLKQAHEKHQRISRDIEELQVAVQRDADSEAATLKATTQKQVERILQQAAVTAKAEREQATRKLRQEIIEEAFVQAEKMLSQAAGTETDFSELDRARRKAVTDSIGALL